MKRRTRFISGLITLAAMSFSLVETVWASTCDPSMQMATALAPDHSPSDMSMHDMDMNMDMGGERDGPPTDVEGGPVQGGDGADCPFGLPGSPQGCATTASMPASAAMVTPLSARRAGFVRPIEAGPRIPPIGSIFRPPKA